MYEDKCPKAFLIYKPSPIIEEIISSPNPQKGALTLLQSLTVLATAFLHEMRNESKRWQFPKSENIFMRRKI
jgi:hypothetical protein